MVHDGFTFDVYDVHIFSNNGTVPSGGRLIPWTGNPFDGSGQVNPVFTGTRTEGFHVIHRADEGTPFSVVPSANANQQAGQQTDSNSDGLLDASDVLQPFGLQRNASLRLGGTSIQRSFYLSSRTEGFTLRARSGLRGSADPFSTNANLARVFFDYGVTTRGNDDGMSFGRSATNGGFRRAGSIDNLGDLSSGERIIAEFPNPIRRRGNRELPEQSIRFDYVYGFEGYDLSLGAGELRYEIEFDFYRD